MKIKKLTINNSEMAQAVEAFLAKNGINLAVHSVTKEYSHLNEWEVVFKFEVEEDNPIPKPE